MEGIRKLSRAHTSTISFCKGVPAGEGQGTTKAEPSNYETATAATVASSYTLSLLKVSLPVITPNTQKLTAQK